MRSDAVLVRPDDELLMVSRLGKVQRIAVADVPRLGRAAMGVSLMKLAPGDSIASITLVRGGS